MYRLTNVMRPYAWGSLTAIADLFGRKPSGGPEAELWIGAHPDSPSTVTLPDGEEQPLTDFIDDAPGLALGDDAMGLFGPKLPFLTKVLAAEEALSLQVHPTLEQARAGYARENEAGIPFTAPERSYRDDNHKPEMIFALTPFQALCGFREPAQSAALFRSLLEHLVTADAQTDLLERVIALLEGPEPSAAIREAFVALLDGGADAAALVDSTANVLDKLPAGGIGPELTTVRWLIELYPKDPGTLISMLLNLVTLEPGDALYLPAGNVHAYLNGLGIEVMATSDNVLRGGLTPKHINIPELLTITDFHPIEPPYVRPQFTDAGQEVYCPPFAEFQLQRIELNDGATPVALAQHGPAVVLAVSGGAMLDSPVTDLTLRRGDSAFIPASEQPVLVHPVIDGGSPAVLFAVTCAGNAAEFDEQRTETDE
ncbi:mannose-6-phosphate isomerase, class I [Arthrobacter sp. USHLN218]|uniref:mannose-6-phosphate isomerase, class I n=1 Tax=Arthrobacter sp. USHLN218 TaxID=3081232 RepID=UPI0030188544